MQIMSVLSDGRAKPVSVQEISNKTGLPKPTCIHILNTLAEDGYVIKVSHSSGYILGASTYYLTRFGKYNQSFVTVCRPVTKWLFKQTGFPVILAVIQGNRKYVIDRIDDEFFQGPQKEDIFTDDIYRTATGRAIMAHMDEPDVRKIYETYGPPLKNHWGEVDSYETLTKKLGEIKGLDYILTRSTERGYVSYGYAKPIFERRQCVGALGVAAYCEPADEENYLAKTHPKVLSALNKAAKEIDRRMRFNV